MKIENGAWIMTAAELAACFQESGGKPGELSLIPKNDEPIEGSKIPEDRASQTEEQLVVFDKCLKVLGAPRQIVLMHYNLGDTTVSRSTLAASEELPGAWVTLVQTGKTMRMSFRSPLEVHKLVFDVLAADNTVRPTKIACDLSTEGALTFLALLDQYRRSWIISLLQHCEPRSLFTIEDLKERLNEASVEDFRWSLSLTDKLLPMPIKAMAVAEEPSRGILELLKAGIIEPVNEENTVFDVTEAGRVLTDGNKQAASRLVLTRTYFSDDGEPAHDVFFLTRTAFDLFMVLMGGAEASLTTLLSGDLDLLVKHVFALGNRSELAEEQEESLRKPPPPAPPPPADSSPSPTPLAPSEPTFPSPGLPPEADSASHSVPPSAPPPDASSVKNGNTAAIETKQSMLMWKWILLTVFIPVLGPYIGIFGGIWGFGKRRQGWVSLILIGIAAMLLQGILWSIAGEIW